MTEHKFTYQIIDNEIITLANHSKDRSLIVSLVPVKPKRSYVDIRTIQPDACVIFDCSKDKYLLRCFDLSRLSFRWKKIDDEKVSK
jgi:hypothetical protein